VPNIDPAVVSGFGDEWARFDQRVLPQAELQRAFESYFAIFPWGELPLRAEGFDMGCGTGRWAAFVAGRVARLNCVDASAEALAVARDNLETFANCAFHCASVDEAPIADGSQDFGYSLGVLHHVPDTAAGIAACARKLKPGAPFLVYLYYDFETRPLWFRALWRMSDAARFAISRLPHGPRYAVSQVIAACVYWPLARLAKTAELAGLDPSNFPLSYYRNRRFYWMRNDALDRFGTRLEQRFSRDQIAAMMTAAGLERVTFSPDPPYWCALAFAAPRSP
jgi:SAM-dependent methyltransferase